MRSYEIREDKQHRYELTDSVRSAMREILPFQLTDAQEKVLTQIVADLESPHPMLRLLQGDVGSGKTIVAALALVAAMESGLQGAFMAPTELLAEQHFRTLQRLLARRFELALMTGSAVGAGNLRAALATGDIQLAVGTHALIQEGVVFERLGLAVVDEQHRFGVTQRQVLQDKGDRPDMLVMTATPIPRSLALTVYGDLEVSSIDELPPGRQPIETRWLLPRERERAYAFLRSQVEKGRQVFLLYPLVQESEKVDARAAVEEYERLQQTVTGKATRSTAGA